MTDKIMIDGVNVRGCENLFALTACDVGEGVFEECEGKDCLYKQLKRKEQECEELKKDIERYKQALERIKKLAEKSDIPPCLNVDCNCDICDDDVTNQGQNCMQRGLNKILQIYEVLDAEHNK